MKKLIVSAVLLGILSAPVFAQKKDQEPLEIIEQEKKRQTEALEQQYKRTMERTRKESDTPRTDPWATMRAPNDGKR